MPLTIIPDVVRNQTVRSLGPGDTVLDAVKLMAEHDVSTVLVIEDGALVGIFTERDVTRRVVAAGRAPRETTLGEVMTDNPDTVAADDRAVRALELMRVNRYRHLPVVDEGDVVAVVSMRDLRRTLADVRRARPTLQRIARMLAPRRG